MANINWKLPHGMEIPEQLDYKQYLDEEDTTTVKDESPPRQLEKTEASDRQNLQHTTSKETPSSPTLDRSPSVNPAENKESQTIIARHIEHFLTPLCRLFAAVDDQSSVSKELLEDKNSQLINMLNSISILNSLFNGSDSTSEYQFQSVSSVLVDLLVSSLYPSSTTSTGSPSRAVVQNKEKVRDCISKCFECINQDLCIIIGYQFTQERKLSSFAYLKKIVTNYSLNKTQFNSNVQSCGEAVLNALKKQKSELEADELQEKKSGQNQGVDFMLKKVDTKKIAEQVKRIQDEASKKLDELKAASPPQEPVAPTKPVVSPEPVVAPKPVPPPVSVLSPVVPPFNPSDNLFYIDYLTAFLTPLCELLDLCINGPQFKTSSTKTIVEEMLINKDNMLSKFAFSLVKLSDLEVEDETLPLSTLPTLPKSQLDMDEVVVSISQLFTEILGESKLELDWTGMICSSGNSSNLHLIIEKLISCFTLIGVSFMKLIKSYFVKEGALTDYNLLGKNWSNSGPEKY